YFHVTGVQTCALPILSFYSKISFQEWEKFHKRLERIKSRYTDTHLDCGFSIDSFVYKNDFAGELSIWPVCEVNYRRTMGLVTYEIGRASCRGGGVLWM